jgi:3-oxoadipate enol-lactonase
MKLMVLSDRCRDQVWQAANPDRVQKLISYTLARAVPEHSTDDYKMGARRQLEARAGHDVINRLQEINLPTLICAGRYDGIAPLENQTTLRDGIRDARLNWYEGGHLFLLQDKQAWQDIVGFLS